MKFVAVLALAVCTVYAAPVAEEPLAPIDTAELEAVMKVAESPRRGIMTMAMLDLRTVIERWAKGEIGLRKSFKTLGEVVSCTVFFF